METILLLRCPLTTNLPIGRTKTTISQIGGLACTLGLEAENHLAQPRLEGKVKLMIPVVEDVRISQESPR